MKESILIVDFGSQVTKLIARRIREIGVFSQIVPFNEISKKALLKYNTKGIIFSGGPKSVNEKNSPRVSSIIYKQNIPILGICYGLQLIADEFGGKVMLSNEREFGKANIILKKKSILTENVFSFKKKTQVWMSHSDKILKMPKGFEVLGSSENCEFAIIQNIKKKNIWSPISSGSNSYNWRN